LKRDVLITAPLTFDAAVLRAQRIEAVEVTVQRDKLKTESGKRPPPEKKKNQSTDVASAEQVVDDIAGIGQKKYPVEKVEADVSPENDPRFDNFVTAMSPEVASLEVDDLVEKYKAWKLLSRVHKDPKILKSMVLKANTNVSTSVSKSKDVVAKTMPTEILGCRFCKEPGHGISNCPKIAAQICVSCGTKGHGARFCPKKPIGVLSEAKEEEKRASAKKSTAKEVEETEEEGDLGVTYSYMSRAKRKTTMEDVEMTSVPEKIKKMTKKTGIN
jgi:hypothetical protein